MMSQSMAHDQQGLLLIGLIHAVVLVVIQWKQLLSVGLTLDQDREKRCFSVLHTHHLCRLAAHPSCAEHMYTKINADIDDTTSIITY